MMILFHLCIDIYYLGNKTICFTLHQPDNWERMKRIHFWSVHFSPRLSPKNFHFPTTINSYCVARLNLFSLASVK